MDRGVRHHMGTPLTSDKQAPNMNVWRSHLMCSFNKYSWTLFETREYYLQTHRHFWNQQLFFQLLIFLKFENKFWNSRTFFWLDDFFFWKCMNIFTIHEHYLNPWFILSWEQNLKSMNIFKICDFLKKIMNTFWFREHVWIHEHIMKSWTFFKFLIIFQFREQFLDNASR